MVAGYPVVVVVIVVDPVGGRGGVQLVLPLVLRSPPRVHEEVTDGAELQAQLLRDRHLHLFGRPLVLFKNCMKCSPLEVGEDEPRLLDVAVLCGRLGVIFFLFTSC